MVKCPKCASEEWLAISCVTITADYLKAMKEDLPSYQYGLGHPEWANVARAGNYIMEFQCKKCNFILPELCY